MIEALLVTLLPVLVLAAIVWGAMVIQIWSARLSVGNFANAPLRIDDDDSHKAIGVEIPGAAANASFVQVHHPHPHATCHAGHQNHVPRR